MIETVISVVLSLINVVTIISAVVLAFVLYLAVNSQKYKRSLRAAFAFSIGGGVLLYGYCHFCNTNGVTAVVRTLLDVGGMFAGNSNEDVINNAPSMEYPLMQFLFWLVHFLAYYTVAGTVFKILSGNWLRRFLLRFQNINLIYGINADTLAIVRELSEHKNGGGLAFVRREGEDTLEKAAQKLGEVFDNDSAIDETGKNIVKQLHLRPGKRKICLYALSQNYDENLNYALFLSRCLERTGIRSEQTSLVMLGHESRDGKRLQALGSKYGYGSVRVADEAELSARVLIQKYPICNVLSFDKQTARAKEDVHFLLIGFQERGRAILRKVVANGQFEGSTFHAAVFDPDMDRVSGMFQKCYPAMLNQYDIRFYPFGGRSRTLYDFLDQNVWQINYIVIAIDDVREGRELALDISDYLEDRKNREDHEDRETSQNIYVCNSDGVFGYLTGECGVEMWNLHGSEFILSDEMDRLAMRINDYYAGAGSEEENWKKCPYFDRMSSRASGDYLEPLLKAVLPENLTPEEVDAEIDKRVENLAKSEHLRWCAFSYSMGWSPMTESEFQARADQYRREKAQSGKGKIRIAKNAEAKTHACLIPWEKLDDLSAAESAVTGKSVNYRLNDTNNIRALASWLRKQEA